MLEIQVLGNSTSTLEKLSYMCMSMNNNVHWGSVFNSKIWEGGVYQQANRQTEIYTHTHTMKYYIAVPIKELSVSR